MNDLPHRRDPGLFFSFLIFLYFLTLSADQLHVQLFLFKPKVGHLIAIFLFATLFFSRKICLPDRQWTLSFAALLSSMCFSLLFSPFFERSLGYVAVCLFSWIVYFLVPISLIRFFCIEKLLRLYFASFFTIGIHAALQVIFSLCQIYDPFLLQVPILGVLSRGQSWTYEPSYYALYAIPFVFFITTQYLFSKENFRSFLISHGLLLCSISTSAFFSYLFFIPIALFFTWRRSIHVDLFRKNLKKFLIQLTAFFFVLSLCFQELFKATFYKFFNATFISHISFAARWKGIVEAWNIFLRNPFFGLGVGGVGPALYIEDQFGSGPIELYEPTLEMIELYDPTNVFTEILASLGSFGFFVFLAISILFTRQFFRALRQTEDPLVREKLLAFFLSSVIMVICLQINQGLFRSYVWVHIAMSIGYLHTLCHSKNSEGRILNRAKFPS